MIREKITGNMKVMEIVSTMSEGNPGAINVMMNLLQDPQGVFDLLHLDDMNIRGSQIWVGFKDWAGQDIEKFREGLRKRDEDMVNCINRECPEVRAVTSGASFKR